MIEDEKIIDLAKRGKLGNHTRWSAIKVWAFSDKHELAEHLREALRIGKELVMVFIDSGGVSEDRVEINYL